MFRISVPSRVSSLWCIWEGGVCLVSAPELAPGEPRLCSESGQVQFSLSAEEVMCRYTRSLWASSGCDWARHTVTSMHAHLYQQ